jgi:hypothetical protein
MNIFPLARSPTKHTFDASCCIAASQRAEWVETTDQGTGRRLKPRGPGATPCRPAATMPKLQSCDLRGTGSR